MSSSKPSGGIIQTKKIAPVSPLLVMPPIILLYKNRIIFPLLLAGSPIDIPPNMKYGGNCITIRPQNYMCHCGIPVRDTNPWPNRRSRLSYVLVHHSFPITSSSILVRYMMTTKAHISLYWWFSNFQNVAAVDIVSTFLDDATIFVIYVVALALLLTSYRDNLHLKTHPFWLSATKRDTPTSDKVHFSYLRFEFFKSLQSATLGTIHKWRHPRGAGWGDP